MEVVIKSIVILVLLTSVAEVKGLSNLKEIEKSCKASTDQGLLDLSSVASDSSAA